MVSFGVVLLARTGSERRGLARTAGLAERTAAFPPASRTAVAAARCAEVDASARLEQRRTAAELAPTYAAVPPASGTAAAESALAPMYRAVPPASSTAVAAAELAPR